MFLACVCKVTHYSHWSQPRREARSALTAEPWPVWVGLGKWKMGKLGADYDECMQCTAQQYTIYINANRINILWDLYVINCNVCDLLYNVIIVKFIPSHRYRSLLNYTQKVWLLCSMYIVWKWNFRGQVTFELPYTQKVWLLCSMYENGILEVRSLSNWVAIRKMKKDAWTF